MTGEFNPIPPDSLCVAAGTWPEFRKYNWFLVLPQIRNRFMVFANGPAEDGRRERLGEYNHPELNQEIEFFGGNYSFLEEGTLSYEGKEVLYLLGTAAVESSCCGRGGCAFIKVPGYVLSWKKGRSESGRPISEVERIASEENQAAIRRILQEKFPGFQQVEFL